MHAFSLNFCCVIDDLKKNPRQYILKNSFIISDFQIHQSKYFTFTLFESFLTL